ncbi:hypothetical protein AVEN_218058-1 [Araneus ventricosus]|uniref:Uncharacterized protein n=1 Tax=Araneus ventricosus TaxID=182803 RepID=A0A4Y2MNM4_ARAVE|nr:hypothetical protein AVEN_218058-1 [Araneus ventricosus]
MLSTTHNLSEELKKNIDLSQVIANVASVLDLLSKQRVNANDNFKTLYAQVKEIAAKLDINRLSASLFMCRKCGENSSALKRLKKRSQEFLAFKQPATTSLTAQKKNTIDELFMYLTLMIFVIH